MGFRSAIPRCYTDTQIARKSLGHDCLPSAANSLQVQKIASLFLSAEKIEKVPSFSQYLILHYSSTSSSASSSDSVGVGGSPCAIL